MNDDTRSSDLHAWIEPELEARVVALVVGEASEFEAGELERLMEERPEIRIFQRRIEAVHGLLGETVGPRDDAGWKLPAERRARLLEAIGMAAGGEAAPVVEPTGGRERHREEGIRRAARRVLWVAAACLALTLFVFVLVVPGGRRAKSAAGEPSGGSAAWGFGTESPGPAMEAVGTPDEAAGQAGGGGAGGEAGVFHDLGEVDGPVESADPAAEPGPVPPASKMARDITTLGGGAAPAPEPAAGEGDAVRRQLERLRDNLGSGREDRSHESGERGAGTAGPAIQPERPGGEPAEGTLRSGAEESGFRFSERNGDGRGNEAKKSEHRRNGREKPAPVPGDWWKGDPERTDKLTEESRSAPAPVAKPVPSPRPATRPAGGDVRGPGGGSGVLGDPDNMPAGGAPAPGVRPAVPPPLQPPAADEGEKDDDYYERGREAPAEGKERDGEIAAPEAKHRQEGIAAPGTAPRKVPLETRIPPGIIEGTPRPMKVPDLLEVPEGPVIAGRGDEKSRGSEGMDAADAERRDGRRPLDALGPECARREPGDADSRSGLGRSPQSGASSLGAAIEKAEAPEDVEETVATDGTQPGDGRERKRPDRGGRDESRREADEAPETSAADEPVSTFSLHVSDVSFKLAAAALDDGRWPERDAIRVEEFVNAFDYGDPAPAPEAKIACRIEQAVHPFMQQRNLVRISLRTAALGRSAATPLRLTVLVDNSGSMERADRVESVRGAFDLLAAQLRPDDQVTLISFARTPRLLADRLAGGKAAALSRLVEATPSEGGTNLEEALRLGLAKAREQFLEGAQNRVILLTDGAANLGNARPEALAALVGRMRQQGLAFDACGVGAEGLNDEILELLTRKGDGRYYFLDRPEDADAGFARQIAGALRPAARDVKLQVRFNPRRVGLYRLHGFDKHLLDEEDFRNDSIDAAELAAEEEGTALYQVEVLPGGEGDVGTVSVRFRDADTEHMVEKSWTIPHDPRPPRLAEAPPAMRLAATAAFLGEKLRGGPAGERVAIDELGRLAAGLQTVYTHSERVGHLCDMVTKVREVAAR